MIRTRRRLLFASILLVALVVIPATAVGAADNSNDPSERVVLTGRLDVGADEVVSSAVIFDGPLVIEGEVDGAAVAMNGDVRVLDGGTVTEQVVALNGNVVIEEGARVEGDVVYSGKATIEGTVEGNTEQVDFANAFDALGIFLAILWWIAISASLLLLGVLWILLFPRGAQRSLGVAQKEIGASIGIGLAVAILLPLIAFGLLFTLIGLPLGGMVLLAFLLLWALGFVTAATCIGDLILKGRSVPVVAFLIGWAILRLVDLVPFVGGLVTFAATVYGVGALAIAAWRAGRGEAAPAEPTAEPEPAPEPA